MKKFVPLLLLLIGFILPLQSQAQYTLHSFEFGGVNRDYFIHVPAGYNASRPAAIVVWLHGMGNISVTNVKNLYAAVKFVQVSDTANFILLVPVALVDNLTSMRAWNSRAGMLGYYPNSTVDDKGFINAMVDSAVVNYVVDPNRIYMCGFSMGGFMTERMALESNYKYAAFASVAGTIGAGITTANPGRPIPIAHFHGTNDQTVAFVNDNYGIDPDSLINFWIGNNACNPSPLVQDTYSDVGMNGTYSVDHYVYGHGHADVEFFKVNGADHEWLPKYCGKIWDFFNKHQRALGINEATAQAEVSVYPNPAENELHLDLPQNISSKAYQVAIYDLFGRRLYNKAYSKSNITIHLEGKGFSPGLYFLRVSNPDFSFSQKIIKR